MADIIVSGARKEREFQGKRCCYRDRGIIVKFLIEKLSIVRTAEEVDQSGLFFVH